MAFTIFQRQKFSLIQTAHQVIVDNMTEPVLVIDQNNQVVDLNESMRSLLAIARSPGETFPALSRPMGSAEELLGFWPELVDHLAGSALGPVDIPFTFNGQHRIYEVNVTALTDHQDHPAGKLAILQDMTELKQAQDALERLATKDSLTQAINRRHFFDYAALEMERARRYDLPLAIVLMDIDRFRDVNDIYGRQAGDQVLRQIAHLCLQHIREVDLFARYGGEEFSLLLPQTDLAHGQLVAERLRQQLADRRFIVGEHQISITASLGIAARDGAQDNLDEMLNRADLALFAAKSGGRNRVDIWLGRLSS